MSKRWFNNFLAVCTVVLMCVGLLVLGGCGGPKGLLIEVTTDSGGNKEVMVETDFQIQDGFKLTRNIQTGEYEVELGSATTKDVDTGVVLQMFQMMQSMLMEMRFGAASTNYIPMSPYVSPIPVGVPVPIDASEH